MISGGLEADGCCEIKASCVAGQGLFATKDLVKGQALFKETAFLVPGRRDDAAVIAASSKLPPLSPITVQHKHCPPCVRLAPTDTGGVLSGCYEETYRFVLAYLSSTASIRSRVQELSSNMRPADTTTTAPATTTDNDGHDDKVDDDVDDNSNAIVTLVRREVAWLRKCDRDLRSLPSRELEGAVHRQATQIHVPPSSSIPLYWANCMGQEGSLYGRGSRFNHSCTANCTRVTLDGGGVERAFITLRPVAAGEELTLSYLPSGIEVMGTVVRRRYLWLSRGFLCSCDRCSRPQDEVRQVVCPECCKDYISPLERRSSSGGRVVGNSRSAEGHSAPACRDGGPYNGDGTRRRPEEETVFAEWWKQSEMWVCQYCGWCSNIDSTCCDSAPSRSLHCKESVVSAEVFALVMAYTVDPRSPSASCTNVAPDGCSGSRGWPHHPDEQLQARRDAVKGMLETSVAVLGRRHWTTFSCAYLRLKLELSARSTDDGHRRPRSGSSHSSSPRVQPEFLDWAMRELNALEQWLGAALGSVTSHPPAYYIFDLVCDLLDARGCSARDTVGGLQLLLGRVEAWVSVFADEDQRRRFAVVSAAVDLQC
ncbi:unnamed protein product [Ectocarpus sp. 13 AM-2016]